MRRNVLALALFGFSLTACDNPPPVDDEVTEESDELDGGSEAPDGASRDATQQD
jgi:hypothetical protein